MARSTGLSWHVTQNGSRSRAKDTGRNTLGAHSGGVDGDRGPARSMNGLVRWAAGSQGRPFQHSPLEQHQLESCPAENAPLSFHLLANTTSNLSNVYLRFLPLSCFSPAPKCVLGFSNGCVASSNNHTVEQCYLS